MSPAAIRRWRRREGGEKAARRRRLRVQPIVQTPTLHTRHANNDQWSIMLITSRTLNLLKVALHLRCFRRFKLLEALMWSDKLIINRRSDADQYQPEVWNLWCHQTLSVCRSFNMLLLLSGAAGATVSWPTGFFTSRRCLVALGQLLSALWDSIHPFKLNLWEPRQPPLSWTDDVVGWLVDCHTFLLHLVPSVPLNSVTPLFSCLHVAPGITVDPLSLTVLQFVSPFLSAVYVCYLSRWDLLHLNQHLFGPQRFLLSRNTWNQQQTLNLLQ